MATAEQGSNLEVLEGGYESFNAGDVESALGILAEDVEWINPAGGRYADVSTGVDSVGEYFARLGEEWETLQVTPERFVDGGDTIVAIGTISGTARESGEAVEVPFAHCCDMADGEITRFQEFSDTVLMARAFEA